MRYKRAVIYAELVGGASQVFETLEELGVSVLSSVHISFRGAKEDVLIGDLAIPDDVSIRELEDRLENLKGVLGVELVETSIGPPIPLLTYRFYFMGSRTVIIPVGIITRALSSLYKRLSTAGRAIIFGLGRHVGESYYEEFKPLLLEQGLSKALREHVVSGLLDRYEIEDGGERIRVWGLVECVEGPATGRPNSEFFRGFVSGLACRILGREVVYMERKCVARGDEYCEFELREARH